MLVSMDFPAITEVTGYQFDRAFRNLSEEEKEALVMLKTTEDLVDTLRKRVLELHPYDVPEFLSLPVLEGYDPYLRWVAGEVKNPGQAE